MEFVVQWKGDIKGRWVLAVDPAGERFLITNDERALHWVPISECEFRAAGPEIPRQVILVAPAPDPAVQKLSVPQMKLNGGGHR